MAPTPSTDTIHVVFTANRNYFSGLAATLLSLLQGNRQHVFHLHVIDGGLTPRQHRFIRERAARFNGANEVTFHQITNETFAGFTPDHGNSYMTYARLLVGTLVAAPRVLYLDTDLLIAGDVGPLWKLDLGSCILAAAPDPNIRRLKDDYPFDDDCGDAPYFNTGVLVIDLDRWRSLDAQGQLLAAITANPRRFTWWDQTAMNALFRGRILSLGAEWNTFADGFATEQRRASKVWHFVGPTKPWTRHLDTPEFELWRAFYGKYVGPRYALLMDSRYFKSYLQSKRHAALCRSTLLREATVLALRVARRRNRASVADFVRRHDGSALSDNRTTRSEVRRYLAAAWGPAAN